MKLLINSVKVFLLTIFLCFTGLVLYILNEEAVYNTLYAYDLIDDSFPKPIKDYDDHLGGC